MKKVISGLLILFLCMAMTGGSVDTSASDLLDELERKEKEQEQKAKSLEQQRKNLEKERVAIDGAYDQIASNLEETDQMIQDILTNIKELELQKAELELEIEELENELEGKRNEIARVRIDLQDTLDAKAEARSQAEERIRVMYEYGDVGFLEVLFESKDLLEMFNRMEYINRIVEADNAIFESLEDYEADVRSKKAELEVHEATLVEMSNAVEAEKLELQAMVDTKNLEVQTAEDFTESQKATQEELEMNIEQLKRMDEELERERRRIDAELSRILEEKAAELQRIAGLDYSGGALLWPVPGYYRISSHFGPRFHPVHKVWRNHDGTDIPAPGGTSIVAAETGEVIISKYSGGYGNYIAIAHGNGYITLYAHCSQRLVSVGDAVARGQVIGKVGSTGWSTGNHLHFAVKLNDKWIEPMNFLK